MESKPIFCVGVKTDKIHYVQEQLERKLTDYHVIAYQNQSDTPIFQLFYINDEKVIDLEELRTLLSS